MGICEIGKSDISFTNFLVQNSVILSDERALVAIWILSKQDPILQTNCYVDGIAMDMNHFCLWKQFHPEVQCNGVPRILPTPNEIRIVSQFVFPVIFGSKKTVRLPTVDSFFHDS
jgi:hypothetical protein